MIIRFIDSESFDGMYGPFLDEALAERVLKIIRMAATDAEDAEIVSFDPDPWKEQIGAGLLPFVISIESLNGRLIDKKVELLWPPRNKECKILEREGYVQYFVWAKTQTEAIQRMMAFSHEEPVQKYTDAETAAFEEAAIS